MNVFDLNALPQIQGTINLEPPSSMHQAQGLLDLWAQARSLYPVQVQDPKTGRESEGRHRSRQGCPQAVQPTTGPFPASRQTKATLWFLGKHHWCELANNGSEGRSRHHQSSGGRKLATCPFPAHCQARATLWWLGQHHLCALANNGSEGRSRPMLDWHIFALLFLY